MKFKQFIKEAIEPGQPSILPSMEKIRKEDFSVFTKNKKEYERVQELFFKNNILWSAGEKEVLDYWKDGSTVEKDASLDYHSARGRFTFNRFGDTDNIIKFSMKEFEEIAG